MGKAKLLIESYLLNRFQRVQLDSSFFNSKTVSTWSKVKHGVPQGSILGPLLFLLYINDLPKVISSNATPILYADDTSILITGQDKHRFQDYLNVTFDHISNWFQVNSLSLNISKTCYIQFSGKNINYSDINITYENNYISHIKEIKFLGLYINNILSWKTHIDKILPKLCSVCFAMKSVKPFVSQDMLKVIYYSHFHSIMTYGLIIWGHSPYSIRAFRLQKRIMRIMMGPKSRDSCRKVFIKLKILPFPSLYIFAFLRVVTKNRELFTTKSEIHKFGTRQHHNFHYPSATLTKYQEGVLYMGINIYNSLPIYIKKELTDMKKICISHKKFST